MRGRVGRAAAGAAVAFAAAACAPNTSAAPDGTTSISGATTTTTMLPTTSPTTSVPAPASTTTTSVAAPPTTSASTTTTSMVATTTSVVTTTTTTTLPPPTTTTLPPTTTTTASAREGSIFDVRPASDIPPPPLPAGWNTNVIGSSVQGRDIVVWERVVPGATKGILVVGAIHGNEPASPPAVRALVNAQVADDVIVWLLPELNPDGVAAGTRWNANGVDLNRNFTWDWRPSDGGPAPLSEPESQVITAFIEQQRPTVVVWVHQPYGYVSSIAETDRALEQAWSEGSGLRTRSGVTQHGGGESWTFFEAELPSMLIEIDTWDATPEIVDAQLAGFQALLDELGWSG